MVWLNIGCVYWMQANSICNNIMWKVGPFMARQYQLALERYEWNKLHSFQSIVPMINLSWNLARKTKISDPQLYRLIKTCMLLTLKQCYLLLKFVKNKGVEVESYDNEAIMHYCDKCLVCFFYYVFNNINQHIFCRNYNIITKRVLFLFLYIYVYFFLCPKIILKSVIKIPFFNL